MPSLFAVKLSVASDKPRFVLELENHLKFRDVIGTHVSRLISNYLPVKLETRTRFWS